MKTNKTRQIKNLNLQRGVVLFVALITLVIMSLAAAGMVRAVDANTGIASNLSYRQSAQNTNIYALEAITKIMGQTKTDNSYQDGNGSILPTAFYSTCKNFDVLGSGTCSGALLLDASTWTTTKSAYATGTGLAANGKDAYGNTIQYIVERMCNATGASSPEKCLTELEQPEGRNASASTLAGGRSPGRPGDLPNDAPLYRITVRVVGPKNTISYYQTYIS